MYEIKILGGNYATLKDTSIDCYLIITDISVLPASEVQVVNDKPYSSLQELIFVAPNAMWCGGFTTASGMYVQVYLSNSKYNPIYAVANKFGVVIH